MPPVHISPIAQAGEHAAAAQELAVHVIPVVHRMPHIPQFDAFVAVSTQPPLQHVCVPGHVAAVPQWQRPSAPQVSPASHAGVHVAAAQVPATHIWPAMQRLPHIPQFIALVIVSMQPPAQHRWAPVHAAVAPQRHMPTAHVSAVVPQSRAHPPHSVRDMLVSTQAPPQHVRPPEHVPSGHAI